MDFDFPWCSFFKENLSHRRHCPWLLLLAFYLTPSVDLLVGLGEHISSWHMQMYSLRFLFCLWPCSSPEFSLRVLRTCRPWVCWLHLFLCTSSQKSFPFSTSRERERECVCDVHCWVIYKHYINSHAKLQEPDSNWPKYNRWVWTFKTETATVACLTLPLAGMGSLASSRSAGPSTAQAPRFALNSHQNRGQHALKHLSLANGFCQIIGLPYSDRAI